ncbi:nuclear transport factor 2 family protein [Euzebya tangerina]|uniref:nuclear transport factor 2 family protein n=1 Tax=Euzebya tangerina TaxID=591198 RepID=UPI000E3144D6|nr:nuclear transport factor 2 family protein [Euzebya tangerina]
MDATDRLAVIDTLNRYGHAYDQGDFEMLARCFTENAVFTIDGGIGDMPTQMRGRDEIVASMRARRAATEAAQRRHLITNIMMDPDGPDRVTAACYLLLGSTEEGTLRLPTTARYTDVLERDGDHWAIAQRTLRLDGSVG